MTRSRYKVSRKYRVRNECVPSRGVFGTILLLAIIGLLVIIGGCSRIESKPTPNAERGQTLKVVKDVKDATAFEYRCFTPEGRNLIDSTSYPVKSIARNGIAISHGVLILNGADGTTKWVTAPCLVSKI
jgi:hypothetical protein